MIFTDQGIYFCFKEPHSFLYEDIEEVVLIKKEEGFDFYAKIKTKANTFVFKNKYLNLVNGEQVYGFPFFVQIVALYLLK